MTWKLVHSWAPVIAQAAVANVCFVRYTSNKRITSDDLIIARHIDHIIDSILQWAATMPGYDAPLNP